jgi:hypothetical protein
LFLYLSPLLQVGLQLVEALSAEPSLESQGRRVTSVAEMGGCPIRGRERTCNLLSQHSGSMLLYRCSSVANLFSQDQQNQPLTRAWYTWR